MISPLNITKFIMMAMIAACVSISANAFAGEFDFTSKKTPTDSANDFWDLDHGYYYTWYIEFEIPDGEEILSAELFFDNIRNWDDEEDHDLWVNLLNENPDGHFQNDADQFNDKDSTSTVQDNEFDDADQIAYYSGTSLLVHYDETTPGFPESPETGADITYSFQDSDIEILTTYVENGKFGIGLDPDCHYYNDGVYLTIVTGTGSDPGPNPVPEPGTLVLLGVGLAGLASVRRKTALKNGKA